MQSASLTRTGRCVEGTKVHSGRRVAEASFCTGLPVRSRRLKLHVAAVSQQQQQQELPSSDSAESSSRCPVLAALSLPPKAAVPWYKRLSQFTNPSEFQNALLKDHSVVWTPAQMGLPETVMARTAELNKEIMNGEGNFVAMFSPVIDGLVGKAGAYESVAQERLVKGILKSSLNPEATANFMPAIVDIASRALARWEAKGAAGVLAHREFKHLTFEVIMQAMLGMEFKDLELDRLSDMYVTYTAGMTAFPRWDLPFTTYGAARKAMKQLQEIMLAHVKEARAAVEAGQEVPGVLGKMINARDQDQQLDDEFIADMIMTLLFAGHDTTSTSLTQLVATIHDHPDVIDKLRQEQQKMLAKHGEEITPAVLKDMAYAEAVIRESLRMNSVAGSLFRKATRDFELEGHRIPQGTNIVIPVEYMTKHDPRWLEGTGDMDPYVFNPDRMLAPEAAKQGWQMPFGYGPRFCLGYPLAMTEMKVVLALIARHYTYKADTNTKWVQQIGSVPVNGLPLVMSRLPTPAGAATQALATAAA